MNKEIGVVLHRFSLIAREKPADTRLLSRLHHDYLKISLFVKVGEKESDVVVLSNLWVSKERVNRSYKESSWFGDTR